MTLDEWCQTIRRELEAAGFQSIELDGVPPFPCVPIPATQEERVRLLNFRASLPVEKRIYAEGCMFVPRRPSQ